MKFERPVTFKCNIQYTNECFDFELIIYKKKYELDLKMCSFTAHFAMPPKKAVIRKFCKYFSHLAYLLYNENISFCCREWRVLTMMNTTRATSRSWNSWGPAHTARLTCAEITPPTRSLFSRRYMQIVFYTCTLLDYHTARFILHFQRKGRFTCQIVFLLLHCLLPFELHILHLNTTAFNLWPIDLTGAEGFQGGRGGCVVVPGAWEHHDPLRIHQEGQRLRDPDGICRLEAIWFPWYLLIF